MIVLVVSDPFALQALCTAPVSLEVRLSSEDRIFEGLGH